MRHAVAIGADLVIKDTHHHSAVARALLTNTDWHLIRTCPTPLWLVKPNAFSDIPTFVAAIDPMHEHDKPAALDDEILQISKMLADRLGGKVHAFHCYDPRIAVAAASTLSFKPGFISPLLCRSGCFQFAGRTESSLAQACLGRGSAQAIHPQFLILGSFSGMERDLRGTESQRLGQ